MTRGAKGRLESSVGFNYGELQQDLWGLFEQNKVDGPRSEFNYKMQKKCVIQALEDGADEIEIHHTIVDALLQSHPTMKLPSKNKYAGELLSSAKRKIKSKK